MAMAQLQLTESVSGNYGVLDFSSALASGVLDFSSLACKSVFYMVAGVHLRNQAIKSLPLLRSQPASGAMRPCT